MAEIVRAFNTKEAQRLSGLSARRLQYWDETDFIRPSIAARKGRGTPRLYAFRDLVQLRVAAVLRDTLSLQALRRLKEALDVDAPFATLRFATTAGGETVYLGPEGTAESVVTPFQVVLRFDVPLREIREDLETNIAAMRRRRGAGQVERKRGVVGSRPVMAGTRVTLQAIRRMLAAGWDEQRIVEEYPELSSADISFVRSRRRQAG